MNLITALFLLLQAPPAPAQGGKATATPAGGETVTFQGGSYYLSARSLTLATTIAKPGIRFSFSSVDEGKSWQPLGPDQSVWLTPSRGGLVKNLVINITTSTEENITATWSAILPEQGEAGAIETQLSGTIDFPGKGKTGPSAASVAKGGVALLGFVCFVLSLGGLIVGAAWLTISGFRESPMWGWVCALSFGPVLLAFLYWGVGGVAAVGAGAGLSVVGILGAIAFGARHVDAAKSALVTYLVSTAIFGIVFGALVFGSEKRPEGGSRPRDPQFYEAPQPKS